MLKINLAEEDIEVLKQKALDFPKETIKLLKAQLSNDLDRALHSRAYYLMAFSFECLKDSNKLIECLDLAKNTAINPEDQIRALVSRAAKYAEFSLNISAFEDLMIADQIVDTNNITNPELLLSIKLTLVYLIRCTNHPYLLETLFIEIDVLIKQSNNLYYIAHYYKAKGLYFFTIKNYGKAIKNLNESAKYFEETKNLQELMRLNQHLLICKFILEDESYKVHKEQYENFLKTSDNIMHFVWYVVSLCNSNINPLTFCNITSDKFDKVLEICRSFAYYSTVAKLYGFKAEKHESIYEYDLAIVNCKKQTEYNLIDLRKRADEKHLELMFYQELRRHLNPQNSFEESSPTHLASSSYIKTYVASNLNSSIIKNSKGKNYEMITSLLIEQFKTQVSICTNSGIKFLETNQIQALESDGNYTILYDQNQKRHISSKPLAYYEKQLDPNTFLRTHRSYIVNKNFIKHFYPGRVGKLELANGLIIEVSARKMAEVRKKYCFRVFHKQLTRLASCYYWLF